MIAVKDKSKAPVKITGGTEPGHATHACGLPIFDISKDPALDPFLRKGAAIGKTKFGNVKYNQGEIIPGYELICTEELNRPGSAGKGWASHWHCELVKKCPAPAKGGAPAKTTQVKTPANPANVIQKN